MSPAPLMESYYVERLAEARDEIAELHRVVGPRMGCGDYMVDMRVCFNPLTQKNYLYCRFHHDVEFHQMPEYHAWQAARQERRERT